MIRLVRHRKARKLLSISRPVKIAAVNDGAAYTGGMTVHIFRGGMGYNIRSPLKRPAVYRRGKGIVHDKRNSVIMSRLCKLLEIQNHKRRVSNRLSEHRLCILTECCV